MRVVVPMPGARLRSVRALVGLVTAVVITVAGLTVTPTAATAADTDVVAIPDANLKAAINRALGGGRAIDQDVTVADAAAVTTLATNRFTGGVADLTGAQALTGLTSLQLPASTQFSNTFTDLTPLAGLTSLTTLTLVNGQITSTGLSALSGMSSLRALTLTNNKITSLSPLSGLTGLTTLAAGTNQVTDLSPLSGLSNLTILALTGNQITDLTGVPAAPGMVNFTANNNKITDVTPLAGRFTGAGLTTLNLSGNKITDASPLAGYGAANIGTGTLTSTVGLLLGNNKIRDFSAFSGWAKKPATNRVSGQNIYVGPYVAGGVHVSLKNADGTALQMTTADVDAGEYDPASGLLTVTDAADASVGIASATQPGTAIWTVNFSADPDGPPQVAAPGDKSAEVGTAITPFTVSAAGGTTPYTWSATGLPAGLSVDPASGEVSGTPTAAGAPTVTVTATDANSRTGSATFTFTVVAVLTAPVVTNPGNKSAPVDAAITPFTVSATGGVTPFTWSATGLPAGLSIDPASGVVSGTPTAQGATSVTVTVTDAGSRTGSATFTITVTPPGINIPDANLRAWLNANLAITLGQVRPPDQVITLAEAQNARVVNLNPQNSANGPFADLTGLEAFTKTVNLGLSQITDPPSTYTDLTPLSGLVKLKSLSLSGGLAGGQVSDLSPLASLPALEQLDLRGQRVRDLSQVPNPSKLTYLDLWGNRVRDLGDLPSLPRMVHLGLQDNQIVDVTPLAAKFDPATLTTLDLAGNQITDATSLAPLGRNGAKLGEQLSSADGLKLERNRIKDFSAFSDWVAHNGGRTSRQSIYVGYYRVGGVDVTLRTDVGTMPVVSPASAGTYDPATGRLTITDPTAASVTLNTSTYTSEPTWTVYFSNPPAAPGDPGGPQISGTPRSGSGSTSPTWGPCSTTPTAPGSTSSTSGCATARRSLRTPTR